jgi:hypothetical protein
MTFAFNYQPIITTNNAKFHQDTLYNKIYYYYWIRIPKPITYLLNTLSLHSYFEEFK